MVVRRNDARRRRLVVDPAVLLDDTEGDDGSVPSSPPQRTKNTAADVRAYSYGADRRSQLKTTDLIPKRPIACLSVVLVLLACVALLNFAATQVGDWSERIGAAGSDLFAIQGQGSLAGWFSSFLLIITGLASLQIYALRQHRCDDYRGTYRLWLWMAALLIVASINCVADLGAVASNLAQSVFGTSFGDRAWIPLAIKLGALSLLMARGLYEVRQSRGSFALVVFVWVAYTLASVLQLSTINQTIVGLDSQMVAGNCILFGTAALLLAHLTYGRFVFLQAHGLMARPIVKKKKLKVKKKAQPKKTSQPKPASQKKKASQDKKASSTVKAKRKVAKPAASSSKSQTANVPMPGKTPAPQSKPAKPASKTPSEVLRELAAASRAKEQAQHRTDEPSDSDHIIGMTKAQRRKQRKLEKQRRRAA